MTTLRFRAANQKLSPSLISRLRLITSNSISDIRARAARGDPLFEITPFQNDWQEVRYLLAQIAREIANGSLPLLVSEGSPEHTVSPEMLRNLIQHFRQIELETQMHSDLEMGYIKDRSEFASNDDDWTGDRLQ